ncbi:MAG: sugar phosphate isomerase/epimerase [Clostridiales bacterium]|nr:sugar phosphate isomerase/epimerase [Clostridiales bacterium]
MKKAISIWSFSNKTVIQAMDLAKKAGFDGIELSLNEAGETSLDSSEQEFLDIKNYAKSINLEIHSVATGLYWSYSMTSNDKSEREKAIAIAKAQMTMAKTLGADSVLIVPGAVGVDFVDGREPIQYDIAYERALIAIKEIAPIAKLFKVNIGIENVWNKFLTSPLEMRNFIDEIDSPYVGAYFDVGNVLINGYPEHWINILRKRIVKVHFKDYLRAAGGLNGFVDLLAGDVNWDAVMKAFNDIGYDGWVTAEMLPPYKYHSDQLIYNTYGSMSSIIDKL